MLLEQLFPSTPPAQLVEGYLRGRWSVSHAALDRVPELVRAAQQARPLELLAAIHGDADAFFVSREGKPIDAHGLTADEAQYLYRSGWTVLCRSVDQSMEPLQRMRLELARAFGVPAEGVRASVFLSPPHAATALDKHFDHFDSIAIQLAGSKTWQVATNHEVSFPSHTHFAAEPIVPMLGQYLHEAPALEMPPHAEKLVMVPGSTLLLPRGTWHRTTEVGGEGSVSVSLMLWPATFETLLAYVLPLWFARSARWRKPMLGLMSGPALRSDAEQTAAECLDELRAALNGVTPSQLFELYTRRHLWSDVQFAICDTDRISVLRPLRWRDGPPPTIEDHDGGQVPSAPAFKPAFSWLTDRKVAPAAELVKCAAPMPPYEVHRQLATMERAGLVLIDS